MAQVSEQAKTLGTCIARLEGLNITLGKQQGDLAMPALSETAAGGVPGGAGAGAAGALSPSDRTLHKQCQGATTAAALAAGALSPSDKTLVLQLVLGHVAEQLPELLGGHPLLRGLPDVGEVAAALEDLAGVDKGVEVGVASTGLEGAYLGVQTEIVDMGGKLGRNLGEVGEVAAVLEDLNGVDKGVTSTGLERAYSGVHAENVESGGKVGFILNDRTCGTGDHHPEKRMQGKWRSGDGHDGMDRAKPEVRRLTSWERQGDKVRGSGYGISGEQVAPDNDIANLDDVMSVITEIYSDYTTPAPSLVTGWVPSYTLPPHGITTTTSSSSHYVAVQPPLLPHPRQSPTAVAVPGNAVPHYCNHSKSSSSKGGNSNSSSSRVEGQAMDILAAAAGEGGGGDTSSARGRIGQSLACGNMGNDATRLRYRPRAVPPAVAGGGVEHADTFSNSSSNGRSTTAGSCKLLLPPELAAAAVAAGVLKPETVAEELRGFCVSGVRAEHSDVLLAMLAPSGCDVEECTRAETQQQQEEEKQQQQRDKGQQQRQQQLLRVGSTDSDDQFYSPTARSPRTSLGNEEGC